MTIMSKTLSAIFIISAADLVVSAFTEGNYLTLSKNRVETDRLREGGGRRRAQSDTPGVVRRQEVCENA